MLFNVIQSLELLYLEFCQSDLPRVIGTVRRAGMRNRSRIRHDLAPPNHINSSPRGFVPLAD